MMRLQNLKWCVAYKQQALTNGATGTSDNIDTLGYDEAVIIVHGTTSDNATNKPSVLKVQQSDTTDATNFADLSGFVGGTDFTVPAAPTATTTAPYAVFNIDKRGRKRYLRVIISPVTTQTFSVIAALARAAEAPNTTTKQNAAVVVAA